MRKFWQKLQQLTAGAFVLAVLSTGSANAAGSNIVLVPGQTPSPDSATVTVQVDTDAQIDVVVIYVTYDPAQLSLVGEPDFSGTPFDSSIPDASIGEGYVKLGRYKAGVIKTGSFPVAKLTFKSRIDGQSSIGVDKSKSLLLEAGKDKLTAATGTNVTLKAGDVSSSPTPPPAAQTETTKKPAEEKESNMLLLLLIAAAILLIGVAAWLARKARNKPPTSLEPPLIQPLPPAVPQPPTTQEPPKPPSVPTPPHPPMQG